MAGVSSQFRLVVGLGNVGARYTETRHNAGFWYADALADRLAAPFREDRRLPGAVARADCAGRDLRLLKPGSLMNRSGGPLAAVARFHKITPAEILVAHDDLDLPPGRARLKRDIDARLGSRDYWRLRIGVGHPGEAGEVIGYVLSRPSPEERRLMLESIERAVEETPRLIVEGDIEGAMNALHQRGG